MELDSTTGIVALAAAAIALVGLIVAATAVVQLRRLRAAQRTVLGDQGTTDLVAHAARMSDEFVALHDYVADVAARLDGRITGVETTQEGEVAFRGLVRYDAYNEMSGRQSCSIALLDARRCGIVISSIHHRDQARVYAKHVVDGVGDVALSPEEQEAVRLALAGEPPPAPEPLLP